MSTLRITSIEEPFRSDRSLAAEAMRLLSRAEFVGCLPAKPIDSLSVDAIRAVSECMKLVDLPAGLLAIVDVSAAALDTKQWRLALETMNDQLEMSPLPRGEWRPALESLGEELLAELLGVSVSSVHRYSAGDRATPQTVAERLHFVAFLLADLAGSYNGYGIRRWFTRPRSSLGGRRPSEMLGSDFDPDGSDARELQALAARLAGAGAAA